MERKKFFESNYLCDVEFKFNVWVELGGVNGVVIFIYANALINSIYIHDKHFLTLAYVTDNVVVTI